MTSTRRAHGRLLRLVVVLLAPLLLTGCGFSLYNVQLPGGAAAGGDVYRVDVQFSNVLDLVPQSAVKVDDVTVGSVEKISLSGYTAVVRLRLKGSVRLPANAHAQISQTSLLGEKFVQLSDPLGATPTGRLTNGMTIKLASTGEDIEVEQLLGSLSLLLNGGGVAQVQTINSELSKALTGKESDVRNLLAQLDTFIGGLNKQKSQIITALEGLNTLSKTLAAQRTTIDDALDKIGPGLKVLADQRSQLTQMLVSLKNLGVVGTRVIAQSKENTLADLKALEPILNNLAAAGSDLPNALELLLTYPFPQNVTDSIRNADGGRCSLPQSCYVNLNANLDLNLQTLLGNLLSTTAPKGTTGSGAGSGSSSGSGGSTSSAPSGSGGTAATTPTVPGVGSVTTPGGSDLLGLLTGGLL